MEGIDLNGKHAKAGSLTALTGRQRHNLPAFAGNSQPLCIAIHGGGGGSGGAVVPRKRITFYVPQQQSASSSTLHVIFIFRLLLFVP